MMPQGKHKEGELKMKTKEKRRKKKCGPEPKDKTEKGLCNPPSPLPLVLEKPTAASLCRLA